MRATIPKPVIVIIALLLVVPASVGAVSSVSNVKAHTPVDQIDDIRVLETWVGGKRVYAYTGAAEAAEQ